MRSMKALHTTTIKPPLLSKLLPHFKPSESKKPYKKSGGDKGMAFMQSMFEAYVKSQKKASKSKKRKKRDYDSSDSSNSE